MIKRAFDCVTASLGLIVLSPVMLGVAIWIKAASPGPVLFRQRRVGRHFAPFYVYKFRTMCVDAAKSGPITWGGHGDPRITPIGRILRKTKLDELPQLFNVVRGDMSLVGPRPEVPDYVELFRDDYQEILQARPGITDIASLKFRDEAAVLAAYPDPKEAYATNILPEKIALAKEYLQRSSLAFDLELILRTLASIAMRRPEQLRGTAPGAAETRGEGRTAPAVTQYPVLLVGNFLYATSGIYGVCDELAAQLTNRGWRVLTTSSKPGRLQRLADMVRTTWRRRNDYAVAQVDVFSGLAFAWAEAVCRTLQVARKPYVLTLHGGLLPEFAARWPRRVRRLLSSAEAVTTPSRFLLETMSRYRADLELCPNPLHLSAYPFRVRNRPRARLIWLRTFHDLYNPSLAVRVLALVRAHVSDVELVMLGPTRQPEALERVHDLAKQLSVADRLTVHGPVSKRDVGAWLDRSDIFLNTTNADNTPVSVMEAMACGLCVVSTNVGGVPYLIRDGEDGLLVPRDDAAAMAAAVCKILDLPGLGERLSTAARKTVSGLDWSDVLPRWERILVSVAEASRVVPSGLPK